jgi:hypothetical protein
MIFPRKLGVRAGAFQESLENQYESQQNHEKQERCSGALFCSHKLKSYAKKQKKLANGQKKS